jgi:hypothetical protein
MRGAAMPEPTVPLVPHNGLSIFDRKWDRRQALLAILALETTWKELEAPFIAWWKPQFG